MRYTVLSMLAIAMLTVAYLAHRHLGRHIPGGGARLLLLRLFLLASGGLFGYAAATVNGATGLYYALIFITRSSFSSASASCTCPRPPFCSSRRNVRNSIEMTGGSLSP